MKLYPHHYPVRIAIILVLICSIIFSAGAYASPDNSTHSSLANNESVNTVNVQETVVTTPEADVAKATAELTTSSIKTEILTPESVNETLPLVSETVTETTTISPNGDKTEPTITNPITNQPTMEPVEENTTEPIVTEVTTQTPPTEQTPTTTETTIPVTVSPNTSSTSAVWGVTGSSESRKYVSNEVIVRYNYKKISNKGLLSAASAKTNTEMGAVVLKDFSSEGLPGMQVVKIPENMSVENAIVQYESDPDVLYAEPNYFVTIVSKVPTDTSFALQWALNNSGQTMGGVKGTVDADIDAPEAWDLSTGKNSIVVAVVDTGVDYNHPDLSANIWNNTDEIPDNGIDDDGNGYIDDVIGWNFYNLTNDPMDVNSENEIYHGTHCAGTIGAIGNNGEGIAGVNWNVKIMPLRFLSESGVGNTANATEAILYASANGADVISNSWGGDEYSQALKDAIDVSPAVVVCAAGNWGTDNDVEPFYPASFTSSNIISVAATNNIDQLPDFSNYGTTSVDLAAPGEYIYSTKKSSSYQYLSGTSMAAPFVAGVAALVKAENSSLTVAQIKSAILNNVDKKSSLTGKVLTGGRLNAFGAVASVVAGKTEIGVVRNGNTWFLDASGNGVYGAGDYSFTFGKAGDNYVSGDWNGDGVTEIGVVRNGNTWLLDASGNGAYGAGDYVYTFGKTGDEYVTGDWDGDGATEIGVVRNGNTWLLDASGNGVYGAGDYVYTFGKTGDEYVTGDWDGDDTTEIGVVRNGNTWLLDASGNGVYGSGDYSYTFGKTGDTFVTGDWNDEGRTKIGVVRSGNTWFLDASGNGVYGSDDYLFTFGKTGDAYVTGDWNRN